MKLDGELAFYHSNIGKAESQSFEFDVNDPYAAGCRSEDEGAKKNEKRVSVDLEANKGNIDPLPSKMEAEDALTSPKQDSDTGVVGLKNESEGQVKDSIKPVSHSPPQDIELLTESPSYLRPDCPRDIESAESSDLPGVVGSLKNPVDIYMDKSVTRCEPGFVVVYKESSDHAIKDICVDEGIPAEEKILLENANEDAAYKFSSPVDPKSEKFAKDNVEVDASFPVFIDLPAITKEESDKVSTNHKFEDLMLNDHETRKLANDVDKEMLLVGYKVLLQDLDEEQSMPLIESNKAEQNCSQVSSEPDFSSKPKESEDRVEEAISTSSSSALAAEKSNGNVSNTVMLENDGITSQSDALVSAATSAKVESDHVGEPKPDDARNSSDSVDVKPDDQAVMTSHARDHGLGETSFSAVGHVSSRMTFLDPVPYSGSISLRSDSSTTSTRSFAFPVLQSEWNSSPVRMAKADRRHYRKHRGWRQGLLCCRF